MFKHVALFLIAVCMVHAVAQGQGPPPAPEMEPSMTLEDFVAERVAELTEVLGLTGEQSEFITPILTEDATRKREAMDAARGQGRSGMRQLKRTIDEIDRDTVEALGEILSEDQVEAYTEWLDDRRKERRKRFREHRGET